VESSNLNHVSDCLWIQEYHTASAVLFHHWNVFFTTIRAENLFCVPNERLHFSVCGCTMLATEARQMIALDCTFGTAHSDLTNIHSKLK